MCWISSSLALRQARAAASGSKIMRASYKSRKDFAERLGREARKIKDIANTEAVVRQWRDYIEELCKK